MSAPFPARRALALAIVPLALLAAGCSSDEPATTSTPSAAATSQASSPAASTATTEASAASQSASPAESSTSMGPSESPTAGLDVGASASASTTPTVAPPTASLKQAASAKLPAKLDGMVGKLATGDGGTTIGRYTGESEDQMLIATLNVGQEKAAALGQLTDARTAEHATCGKLAATGLSGCYLWLEGGNIQLYGTNHTSVEDLRQYAESLYAQLA